MMRIAAAFGGPDWARAQEIMAPGRRALHRRGGGGRVPRDGPRAHRLQDRTLGAFAPTPNRGYPSPTRVAYYKILREMDIEAALCLRGRQCVCALHGSSVPCVSCAAEVPRSPSIPQTERSPRRRRIGEGRPTPITFGELVSLLREDYATNRRRL